MRPRLAIAAALLLVACSPNATAPVADAASQAASAVAAPLVPPVASTHILAGVDLDAPLTLLGTEPFWNIGFGSGRLVFSSPDSHEGRTTTEPFQLNQDGAAWHGEGMDIYLTPVHCSDGMSDRVYPLKAVVHIGTTKLKGCAASTAFIEQDRP